MPAARPVPNTDCADKPVFLNQALHPWTFPYVIGVLQSAKQTYQSF